MDETQNVVSVPSPELVESIKRKIEGCVAGAVERMVAKVNDFARASEGSMPLTILTTHPCHPFVEDLFPDMEARTAKVVVERSSLVPRFGCRVSSGESSFCPSSVDLGYKITNIPSDADSVCDWDWLTGVLLSHFDTFIFKIFKKVQTGSNRRDVGSREVPFRLLLKNTLCRTGGEDCVLELKYLAAFHYCKS